MFVGSQTVELLGTPEPLSFKGSFSAFTGLTFGASLALSLLVPWSPTARIRWHCTFAPDTARTHSGYKVLHDSFLSFLISFFLLLHLALATLLSLEHSRRAFISSPLPWLLTLLGILHPDVCMANSHTTFRACANPAFWTSSRLTTPSNAVLCPSSTAGFLKIPFSLFYVIFPTGVTACLLCLPRLESMFHEHRKMFSFVVCSAPVPRLVPHILALELRAWYSPSNIAPA